MAYLECAQRQKKKDSCEWRVIFEFWASLICQAEKSQSLLRAFDITQRPKQFLVNVFFLVRIGKYGKRQKSKKNNSTYFVKSYRHDVKYGLFSILNCNTFLPFTVWQISEHKISATVTSCNLSSFFCSFFMFISVYFFHIHFHNQFEIIIYMINNRDSFVIWETNRFCRCVRFQNNIWSTLSLCCKQSENTCRGE